MAHAWDSLVLGGTGVPRILGVDQNYCDNSYFDENTTGWGEYGTPGFFSREVNSDAMGEYMGKLSAPITEKYAYYSWDTGAAVNGRVFMASIRIKTDAESGLSVKVALYDASDNEIGSETVTIDTSPVKVTVVKTAFGVTGNYVILRIYGTNGNIVYFDDLYLTEVFGDYSFPQPTASTKLLFEKVQHGKNELLLGRIQEFGKMWRPSFYCGYEHIPTAIEIYRQEISEYTALFCIPHRDVSWGFLGIWDENFERSYSFNKFFGHRGVIKIKGIELFTHKPIYQSDGGFYLEDA